MPGFDRSERVRRRVEYQRIYDKGVKVHGPKFTLFRFPNGLAEGRLGIAATRKLGGAVTFELEGFAVARKVVSTDRWRRNL